MLALGVAEKLLKEFKNLYQETVQNYSHPGWYQVSYGAVLP